jgi:hypothetical protein
MTIDLFGDAEPDRPPAKAPARPVWSRVPRQRHEPCTPCTVDLHDNWSLGKPFLQGAKRAVYVRKEAGGTLYLCEEHAAPLRAAESREKAKDHDTAKRGRGRPHWSARR